MVKSWILSMYSAFNERFKKKYKECIKEKPHTESCTPGQSKRTHSPTQPSEQIYECTCMHMHTHTHTHFFILHTLMTLVFIYDRYNKKFRVCGSLSLWHGASSGCRWRNGLQYGGQLWINWISSRGQPTRGGPPAWGLGEALTTPPRETIQLRNTHGRDASSGDKKIQR